MEVESAYGFGVLLRDELRGLVLHSLLHRDMRVRSRQLREATAADDREEVGVALGVELLEALQGGGDGGVEVFLVRRGLRCAKHIQTLSAAANSDGATKSRGIMTPCECGT